MLKKEPDYFYERIKKLLRFPDDYRNKINSFAHDIDNGYIPIIYSNHQSHTDGIILAIIVEEIRKQISRKDLLKGFLCPVAASMASGDQNDTVQGGTFLLEPIFTKVGFVYVPIIRQDDRRKYGMKGSNTNAIAKILHAPLNNFGIAIFPEGTVQGGRTNEKGEIFGMQFVNGGGLFLRCIGFWLEQGKKSSILPVGIENSYKTFSPDSYDIPQPVIDMIDGKSELQRMVNATIGDPITSDELLEMTGEKFDPKNQQIMDFLMRRVAELLPEKARGYYK